MQVHRSSIQWRVGVDLGPASRLKESPGTAVHVSRQLAALFKLDVPWEWVPVAESLGNPLLNEFAHWNPSIVAGKSYWRRALFSVGSEWQRRGCHLGFATAFFAPWRGIPVMTNFFDAGMFTKEYARSWSTSGKGWDFRLIKALGTHALRRSQKLFVDSEYWRDFLLERFPSWGKKVIVTPCGVERPRAIINTIPSWASSLQRPFFLYVGTFSDNKNQVRLIELWTQHQSIYADLPALVLLGPCSDSYREARIDPALKKLPRPQEVLLPGLVSDDDLAWAFQHALAYLQPSFMEGFGMPVIEAMSYGLPVACSDTTSLPETAGGASLLFTPGDLSSIGESVLTLWRDESVRETLRNKGYERASQFTWQNNAQIIAEQMEGYLTRSRNSHQKSLDLIGHRAHKK